MKRATPPLVTIPGSLHLKHAIVVGSGLAGMTAAYRLQQQGWSVTVLEAGARAGGRVLSLQRDGFVLDLGPTLITDKYNEYLKLVHELGLSSLLVDSSPVIGVVSGRTLHLLDASKPLSSFITTRLLTTTEKLKLIVKGLQLIRPLAGLNPYELSNRVHYDAESMASYLNRVFGQKLNDSLLAAVARGVTLSVPDDASVIEFFAGAVAASGKMQNLIGGMDVLPNALAARLDIRLDTPVTAVRRSGDGVCVSYRAGDAVLEMQADACILTPRFKDAAALYAPLQQSGARLLRETVYAGCYSLQLLYDRRTQREPFIIMVPRSASTEISTVFLEHMKAPDRAPAGKSQLTAFFNLSCEHDFARWSDERLTTVARDFVESLFPELRGHFAGSQLTRWDYAAHRGNVGYYQALDELLHQHPADNPVQLAGDYMAVSGQESAVIAGVKAAQRIMQRDT